MENTTKKEILLDCRDVSLGYEGKPVWEHLTFQVPGRGLPVHRGRERFGKSTLLKSLLGLLKPLSGEIVHADTLRGGSIGYLPQQTRGAEGLPRHGDGGGSQRLYQRKGNALFLHRPGEVHGADEHGQAGRAGAEGQVLP